MLYVIKYFLSLKNLNMTPGKVLLGVLAGVAAGTLLGILFAPEKGIRTRRKILNKGEDYAESLQEKFEDLVASISNKYERTKDEANDLIANGKMRFDDVKKEAKSSIS
jgi:gas vesicle protein